MFKTSLSRSRWLSAVFPLAAAAALSAGCGEITKQQECSAVIEVINGGQTVMAKTPKFDDPKDVDAHAKELEDYGKKIGDVKVTDAELKKQVGEFHQNIDDLAKFLRDISKGSTDLAKMQKQANEIDGKRSELVKSINGYCSRQ